MKHFTHMAPVLLYHFYSLILLLLSISCGAQSYANVSLDSSLTASDKDSESPSWVSPSGDFAFGFRKIDNQGFLLAIWFNKIPERTIVWSINRDNYVQSGSKVELTRDGNFVLTDSTGKQTQIAAPGAAAVAYAAMLDTGNFVLASGDSVNLWESFDYPTDTILPTQIMNQGMTLYAPISDTNFSTGRFMLYLQNNGNLQLLTTSFPLDTPNFAYWSTSTTGSGFQLIFNQSASIYVIAKNQSIVNMISSDTASTQDFYKRATVDSDGIFRLYIYPKSTAAAGGKWPMRWSTLFSTPSNICLAIREDTGSGACGLNSYCSLGEDSRKLCQCPYGYTFVDQDDVMKGCQRNFAPQSCEKASEEMGLFELRALPNTDWPLNDYEYYQAVSEDWCRQVCLSDCFCDAAIFRDAECWKKRVPLSNGRVDPSTGGKALIKVRIDNSTSDPASKKIENSTLIYILSGLLGSSAFLNLFFLLATCFFFYRLNQRKLKTPRPEKGMPVVNLQSFTYKELAEVTGGFKEELGSGAFGTVYKGVIANENNKFVAVKKLNKAVTEGEEEFKAELTAIGRTNHKNLMQLLGFCNEGQHRLLVYEYMSNGSLSGLLFEDSKLDWYKRMQIAFGIARGLYYLHEECINPIMHCDIKPQNILLDNNLTARISDFGLAKLLKVGQTHTTTKIRGTKGYVAPEWFKNLPVTSKVDVYSFGILLLELVCSRRTFDINVEEECQIVLADWAYDCFREGRLDLLVENDEDAMEDMKRVEKFVMISIWCIQEDPSLRPTMKKVAQMMEGAVEVSIPPNPYSFISSI